MRLNARILKLLTAVFNEAEAGGFEAHEECQPGISDAAEETRKWLEERWRRYS